MSSFLKKFSISALLICLMINVSWAADQNRVSAWHFPTTGEIIPNSQMNLPVNAPSKATDSVIGRNFTTTITYQDVIDGSNFGFDDPASGSARRAVMIAVFAYLDSVLGEASNTLTVHFNASINSPGASTLAAAGTSYFISSFTGYQSGFAFNKIVDGVDNNNPISDPEVVVTVNFGKSWNDNPGVGTTGGSEFDLFTVLLHEITHGLGVASLANSDGTSSFFGVDFDPGVGFSIGENEFTTWDNLLYQTAGTVKVWGIAPLTNTPATDYNLAANGLFQGPDTIEFRGAQTMVDFGSAPPISTEIIFSSGSSVSHWQQTSPIPATTVMRPAIAAGVENRQFNSFEIAAFIDLGYINATPVTLSGFEIE